MPITTRSSPLSAAARRAVGLKPHDRVAIEARGKEILVRKAPDFFALKGFLGRALPREQERRAMLKALGRRTGGRE